MKTSTGESWPRRWTVKLGMAAALVLVLAVGAACGASTGEATQAPTKGGAGAPSAAASSAVSSEQADAGKKIAQANCFTCHSTDGRTIVGPTWKGVYGSKVELQSGQTVTADDAYIKESIQDPNAKIVKGYPAAMPSFKGVLSDQQISDVIAYIKTLK